MTEEAKNNNITWSSGQRELILLTSIHKHQAHLRLGPTKDTKFQSVRKDLQVHPVFVEFASELRVNSLQKKFSRLMKNFSAKYSLNLNDMGDAVQVPDEATCEDRKLFQILNELRSEKVKYQRASMSSDTSIALDSIPSRIDSTIRHSLDQFHSVIEQDQQQSRANDNEEDDVLSRDSQSSAVEVESISRAIPSLIDLEIAERKSEVIRKNEISKLELEERKFLLHERKRKLEMDILERSKRLELDEQKIKLQNHQTNLLMNLATIMTKFVGKEDD